jgi:hypothetical protein
LKAVILYNQTSFQVNLPLVLILVGALIEITFRLELIWVVVNPNNNNNSRSLYSFIHYTILHMVLFNLHSNPMNNTIIADTLQTRRSTVTEAVMRWSFTEWALAPGPCSQALCMPACHSGQAAAQFNTLLILGVMSRKVFIMFWGLVVWKLWALIN